MQLFSQDSGLCQTIYQLHPALFHYVQTYTVISYFDIYFSVSVINPICSHYILDIQVKYALY